jgi:NhaP-type Na+/H+ or K+/H+ antiporter
VAAGELGAPLLLELGLLPAELRLAMILSRSLGLLASLHMASPLLLAAASSGTAEGEEPGSLLALDAEIVELEQALAAKRTARLAAQATLQEEETLAHRPRALQDAGGGDHDDKPEGPAAFVAASGHTTDLWRTDVCVPVRCGEDAPLVHDLHHPSTTVGAAMDGGCMPYEIYNFMKNETDTVHMTCAGCVPHVCAYGEHDCVPTYCEDDSGDMHGGHSVDPCDGGHHSDDGLTWWPFLLCCLLATVAVTGVLKKLGNGVCFGRSVNPPFTVVMFFFGYLISSLCSQDGEHPGGFVEDHHGHGVAGILVESVQSWKAAHPHVILFVLLPPLLFEDASGMEYYVFRKVLMSSILLAGPGVGISMILTALTSMVLFGFAPECVVEVDAVTGAQMVDGARENTVIDGVKVCDPLVNRNWQEQEGPDGGLLCMECVEGSHVSEQLPIAIHLLLGGMLAATDPVAVCAVLNDLGCPARLNYMIAGESLLNDGTAVVAFMVMQSVAGGCDTSAMKVLNSLITLAGGGVLWGLFMASATYQAVKHLRDPNIEITTLVFSTLSTFWLAENVLGVSGVLGTVVFGVQTARTSFLAMDEHTHHANHAFWGEVGYVATSIIFILAGVKSRDKIASFLDNFAEDFEEDKEAICSVIVEERVCLTHHVCRWDGPSDKGLCSVNLAAEANSDFHVGNQLFLNVLLWFILMLIRGFVVLLFSPLLRNIGYGLTKKEAVVMVWGGLRGAVSLALALLIDGNHLIGDRAREMIFLQTTGIVTLTLVINGTTSGMVYKWLEVYPPNPFRPALATQGLRNIQQEMDKVIHKLSSHWFHGNADLDTLVKLMPNFSNAFMQDGGLTDIDTKTMQAAWMKSKDNMLVPANISAAAEEMSTHGVLKILDHCSPVNFDVGSFDLGDTAAAAAAAGGVGGAEAPAPNSYGRIRLVAGDEVQSFETAVARAQHSPAWADGTASHDFTLPLAITSRAAGGEGADENSSSSSSSPPVRLHVDLFDNDFGEEDERIGECSIDLTDLCMKGGDVHKTLELQPASRSQMGSPRRQSRGSLGSVASSVEGQIEEAVGTVSLAISCIFSDVGKELKVNLMRGKLYPRRVERALRSPRSPRSPHTRKLQPGGGSLGRTFSMESTGSNASSAAAGGGGHGHGGHGDEEGGHGHGPSHMDKLRNIKRWLQESDPSIEHSFAMYDIMLNAMRTNFAHECEGKSISVESYSKLSAAIGTGLDVNDAQMHSSENENENENESNGDAGNNHDGDDDGLRTPLDAVVDCVLDFADHGLTTWSLSRVTSKLSGGGNGADGGVEEKEKDPTTDVGHAADTSFFSHRMLCAEMFLVLIDQLSELTEGTDTDDTTKTAAAASGGGGGGDRGHHESSAAAAAVSDLGHAFTGNAAESLERCKRKLAEMQLAAPNTFRTCHTLLGFNVVAAEFHHRVHAYEDQGFFAADMVAAADSAMLTRHQELAQYFAKSPLMLPFLPLMKAMPFIGKSLRSHPVFYAFDADKRGPLPEQTGRRGESAVGSEIGAGRVVLNPMVVSMRDSNLTATTSAETVGSTLDPHGQEQHEETDNPMLMAVPTPAAAAAGGGATQLPPLPRLSLDLVPAAPSATADAGAGVTAAQGGLMLELEDEGGGDDEEGVWQDC